VSVEEIVMFPAIVLTCTMVAVVFRPLIRRSRGFWLFALGIALVYVGVVGCALLFSAGEFVAVAIHDPRDLDVVSSLPLAVAWIGFLFASKLWYVTIPLGVASVAILRRIGRRRSTGSPIPGASAPAAGH
jgi:hypothetical protein